MSVASAGGWVRFGRVLLAAVAGAAVQTILKELQGMWLWPFIGPAVGAAVAGFSKYIREKYKIVLPI